MLGLLWESEPDTFHCSVKLELKYRDEEDVVRELKVTSVQALPSLSATIISRRLMLKKHCQDI